MSKSLMLWCEGSQRTSEQAGQAAPSIWFLPDFWQENDIICCVNINKNKLTSIFPGNSQAKKKNLFHGAASNSY